MAETAGTWKCERCGGAERGRLEYAPWPGPIGERVRSSICQGCWQEWLGLQTKFINEYRLNVLDPNQAKALRDQMEIFFGFKEAEPAP